MKANRLTHIAITLLITLSSYAQVGIGTGTPDSSAVLDLTATDKGLLIPRMTGTQRDNINNPASGLIVYCTDCSETLYIFKGGAWTALNTNLDETAVDSFVADNGYLTSEIDGSTTNEIQDLDLNNNVLSLTGDATTVDLNGYLDNTDDQAISRSGLTVTLENGGSFQDSILSEAQVDSYVSDNGYLTSFTEVDGSTTNEIQDLSLSGNTLSLTSDGTPVDLGGYLDNTDDQTISRSGLTVTLENGGSFQDSVLSEAQVDNYVSDNGYLTSFTEVDGSTTNEIQDLSLSGNTLSLTSDGTPVDLGGYLDNTDDQTISRSGLTVTLENGGSFQDSVLSEAQVDSYVSDNGYLTSFTEVDGSTTNEIQDLNLSGNTLSLTSDGTPVDLGGYLDNTDDQAISRSGLTVTLENGGSFQDSVLSEAQVDSYVSDNGYLTSFTEVDGSTTNEIQDLSLSGNTLSLTSDGTPVDLGGYLDNTDNQTLSLSNDSLSIEDGNKISLGDLKDNLGDHVATNNLQMNGEWISNDGDDEGVYVAGNGKVGIGMVPAKNLDVYDSTRAYARILSGSDMPTALELSNSIGNWHFSGPRSNTNDLNLYWNPLDQGGFDLLMSFGSDGLIGVGTEQPSADFHINGSFKLQDGSEQEGSILQSDADGDATWVSIDSINDNMGDHTATEHIKSNGHWITNDGDRDEGIFITSGGKVGIGTDSARANFEVAGAIQAQMDIYTKEFHHQSTPTDTTIYNNYLGRFDTYNDAEITIVEFYPGSASYFRVTRERGSAPVISMQNNAMNGNFRIHYRILDANFFELFFEDMSGYNQPRWYQTYITTTLHNTYTDPVSASNNNDILPCAVSLATDYSGKVGIGTHNPAQQLHVVGNMRLEDGSEGADKILQSDAEGDASWVSIDSISDNMGDHTATQNIKSNGHWISNDGNDEGIFVEANGEIRLGKDSYVSKKTWNFAPGSVSTLYTQYLGTFQVKSGTVEIRITDSGNGHGASSFFRVTRDWGVNPVVAIQNNGSPFGYIIHYRNINDGTYELFFEPLGSQTSHTIEYKAFINIHDGLQSDAVSASNDTDINPCEIGVYTDLYARVGIGINPSVELEVDGDTKIHSKLITETIEGDNGSDMLISANGQGMDFLVNDNNFIAANPFKWYSASVLNMELRSQTGSLWIKGNYFSTSDQRLKTNIVRINKPIEKIKALGGYTYQRTDTQDTSKQVGVLAQEVEAVLPELVLTRENGDKAVNYSSMGALYIEAIKEQQAMIETLTKDLKELRREVAALKRRSNGSGDGHHNNR